MAPPAVKPRVPVTVDAPMPSALVSVMATFTPVTNTSVIKSLPAVVNVTLLPALVIVVIPVTAKAPVCVIAPPAVKPRVPVTVEAPRTSASVSVIPTLEPDVVTAPVKLLPALVSVIAFPVAVNDEVPVTVKASVWVIVPPLAVTVRLPPTAPSVPASMNKSPSPVGVASKTIPALSIKVIFPNVPAPAFACRVTVFE